MNDSTDTSTAPPQYRQLLTLIGLRYRDKALFDKMIADAGGLLPWVPGEKVAIDFNHDDNRVLALCLVVGDLTYDHANGRRLAVVKGKTCDFNVTDEILTANLIRAALEVMHAPALHHITTVGTWNSAFARFKDLARSVDSIFDETKMSIARGTAQLTANPSLKRRCKPARLLFEAFPYAPKLNRAQKRYAMMVGRCMMRDYLALTLRPSFGNDPLIPQLMYTLVDEEEGGGKSSFCCVLAGGAVGDVGGHPRFTDLVTVQAILGNSTHGQQQLAAIAVGRTVCEWADKNLGSMNETQSSAIKSYINNGTVQWRDTYGRGWLKVNRRSLDIVTTNNEAILTVHLGVRRLPIVDLKQWRLGRTAPAAVIAQNHNTGLDWLAAHRDVVLAIAYAEGLWRGSLAPPPALLKMMYEKAEAYTRHENWQVMLETALEQYQRMVIQAPKEVIAVPMAQLSVWAVVTQGARAPSPNLMGRFMTRLGWASIRRFVKRTTNTTERMRVIEGAAALESRLEHKVIDPIITKVLAFSPALGTLRAIPVGKYDDRYDVEKYDGELPF
jgi:hypothetical protein